MKLTKLLEKHSISIEDALVYVSLTNDELKEKLEEVSDEFKLFINDLIESKIDGLSGVVFDLEATCEDKKIVKFFDNEIIEIGAVKVINGIIVDDFSSFVKPQKTKITKFCTELTSITYEDVKNSESFPIVLKEFREYANDLPVLSWGLYDKKQLIKDIKRHNLSNHYISWLEDKHRSLKHEHGTAFNLKGGRGVGVPTALKMCNESFEGFHHRGINDAYNIAKIFIKNKDVFMR